MAYRDNWLSPVLIFNNALIWISALIVTGITAWFVNLLGGGSGYRIIYQLVIAVLTVLVYPIVLFLSRGDSYRGYLMPVNLIFSYLWLTSFIFSAEDWSQDRCYWSYMFDRCGYKHTVMAFNFISFFFLFLNSAIEGYLARRPGGAYGVEKRPRTTSTDVAGAGTTTTGHGQGVV